MADIHRIIRDLEDALASAKSNLSNAAAFAKSNPANAEAMLHTAERKVRDAIEELGRLKRAVRDGGL